MQDRTVIVEPTGAEIRAIMEPIRPLKRERDALREPERPRAELIELGSDDVAMM